MASYTAPGVKIEEITKLPPSVAEVATAVPAFIGYPQKTTDQTTGKDVSDSAVVIRSLEEYKAKFGTVDSVGVNVTLRRTAIAGTTPTKYTYSVAATEIDASSEPKKKLYYHMQFFYANGGGKCYVVPLKLSGNPKKADFDGGLAIVDKEDEPTLLVMPEATQISGINNFYGACKTALQSCRILKDRFAIIDTLDHTEGAKERLRQDLSGDRDELMYGAAYYPFLETTIPYVIENEELVKVSKVVEIGSDGTEGEASADTLKGKKLSEIKPDNDSLYNAIKAELLNLTLTLPPSAAVAGVYAKVDRTRGVHKAPANQVLSLVRRPTVGLNDDQQGEFNVNPGSGKSINVIRSFTGKGTKIWGARTLTGNDNEWRYVNVRRFFNTVEESVKKATSQFVFEPNSASTWVRVKAMISNYLEKKYNEGALQGGKPDEAFYVHVGLGETMSYQNILEGEMIVEIGMAVVRPAEFIILRFSHKMLGG